MKMVKKILLGLAATSVILLSSCKMGAGEGGTKGTKWDLTMTVDATENANKPLELEDPKKEVNEEMSQPTLKDDIPKDCQFKKAHPQDLIIGDITKGITIRSQLKSIINLAFIS